MNKRITLSILLLVIGLVTATADKKEKYQKLAEAVRNEVWSKDLPAFNQRTCPEEYKKHSAVALAFYNELTVDQHLKVNLLELLFMYNVPQMVTANYYSRTLMAINDEKAREKYSEFDFTTIQRDYMQKRQTVVGVRVIKPSGEVREVNADDYIVIDEGQGGRDQRRKLAVPDLQVGDLIDYFYYTIDDLQEHSVAPFHFQLISDKPVLSYQAHCVIDRSMTTQYRSLNGAPNFRESTDADGNVVLDLEMKDIRQTEPSLFYNSAEQSPSILLYINGKTLRGQWTAPSTKQKGLQANPHFSLIVDDDVAYRKQFSGNVFTGKEKKEWQQYCDRIAAMDISKEERVARLYIGLHYMFRFSKSSYFTNAHFITALKEALQQQGITSHDLYTTHCLHEPIDQLISYQNTTWGLYVLSIDKVLLEPAYDMSPFTIPSHLQGRAAVLDDGNGEIITLDRSTCDDNQAHFYLNVTLPGLSSDTATASPTLLSISRRNVLTGVMRENASDQLVMNDRLMADAFSYIGIERTPTDLVSKKYHDDLEEGIRLMHDHERKLYTSEASVFHDTAIDQLIDYRMENIGFRPDSTALIFSSSYTIDGLVKRAGPNLVLSVGQLRNQSYKIEGADRERTAGIHYGRPPRQLVSHITITLPQGYTPDAESLQKLNVNVSNSCGAFTAKAHVDGRELLLTTNMRYNHSEEPLEKWPEVLAFIDAASDFNTAQLILRHE